MTSVLTSVPPPISTPIPTTPIGSRRSTLPLSLQNELELFLDSIINPQNLSKFPWPERTKFIRKLEIFEHNSREVSQNSTIPLIFSLHNEQYSFEIITRSFAYIASPQNQSPPETRLAVVQLLITTILKCDNKYAKILYYQIIEPSLLHSLRSRDLLLRHETTRLLNIVFAPGRLSALILPNHLCGIICSEIFQFGLSSDSPALIAQTLLLLTSLSSNPIAIDAILTSYVHLDTTQLKPNSIPYIAHTQYRYFNTLCDIDNDQQSRIVLPQPEQVMAAEKDKIEKLRTKKAMGSSTAATTTTTTTTTAAAAAAAAQKKPAYTSQKRLLAGERVNSYRDPTFSHWTSLTVPPPPPPLANLPKHIYSEPILAFVLRLLHPNNSPYIYLAVLKLCNAVVTSVHSSYTLFNGLHEVIYTTDHSGIAASIAEKKSEAQQSSPIRLGNPKWNSSKNERKNAKETTFLWFFAQLFSPSFQLIVDRLHEREVVITQILTRQISAANPLLQSQHPPTPSQESLYRAKLPLSQTWDQTTIFSQSLPSSNEFISADIAQVTVHSSNLMGLLTHSTASDVVVEAATLVFNVLSRLPQQAILHIIPLNILVERTVTRLHTCLSSAYSSIKSVKQITVHQEATIDALYLVLIATIRVYPLLLIPNQAFSQNANKTALSLQLNAFSSNSIHQPNTRADAIGGIARNPHVTTNHEVGPFILSSFIRYTLIDCLLMSTSRIVDIILATHTDQHSLISQAGLPIPSINHRLIIAAAGTQATYSVPGALLLSSTTSIPVAQNAPAGTAVGVSNSTQQANLNASLSTETSLKTQLNDYRDQLRLAVVILVNGNEQLEKKLKLLKQLKDLNYSLENGKIKFGTNMENIFQLENIIENVDIAEKSLSKNRLKKTSDQNNPNQNKPQLLSLQSHSPETTSFYISPHQRPNSAPLAAYLCGLIYLFSPETLIVKSPSPEPPKIPPPPSLALTNPTPQAQKFQIQNFILKQQTAHSPFVPAPVSTEQYPQNITFGSSPTPALTHLILSESYLGRINAAGLYGLEFGKPIPNEYRDPISSTVAYLTYIIVDSQLSDSSGTGSKGSGNSNEGNQNNKNNDNQSKNSQHNGPNSQKASPNAEYQRGVYPHRTLPPRPYSDNQNQLAKKEPESLNLSYSFYQGAIQSNRPCTTLTTLSLAYDAVQAFVSKPSYSLQALFQSRFDKTSQIEIRETIRKLLSIVQQIKQMVIPSFVPAFQLEPMIDEIGELRRGLSSQSGFDMSLKNIPLIKLTDGLLSGLRKVDSRPGQSHPNPTLPQQQHSHLSEDQTNTNNPQLSSSNTSIDLSTQRLAAFFENFSSTSDADDSFYPHFVECPSCLSAHRALAPLSHLNPFSPTTLAPLGDDLTKHFVGEEQTFLTNLVSDLLQHLRSLSRDIAQHGLVPFLDILKRVQHGAYNNAPQKNPLRQNYFKNCYFSRPFGSIFLPKLVSICYSSLLHPFTPNTISLATNVTFLTQTLQRNNTNITPPATFVGQIDIPKLFSTDTILPLQIGCGHKQYLSIPSQSSSNEISLFDLLKTQFTSIMTILPMLEQRQSALQFAIKARASFLFPIKSQYDDINSMESFRVLKQAHFGIVNGIYKWLYTEPASESALNSAAAMASKLDLNNLQPGNVNEGDLYKYFEYRLLLLQTRAHQIYLELCACHNETLQLEDRVTNSQTYLKKVDEALLQLTKVKQEHEAQLHAQNQQMLAQYQAQVQNIMSSHNDANNDQYVPPVIPPQPQPIQQPFPKENELQQFLQQRGVAVQKIDAAQSTFATKFEPLLMELQNKLKEVILSETLQTFSRFFAPFVDLRNEEIHENTLDDRIVIQEHPLTAPPPPIETDGIPGISSTTASTTSTTPTTPLAAATPSTSAPLNFPFGDRHPPTKTKLTIDQQIARCVSSTATYTIPAHQFPLTLPAQAYPAGSATRLFAEMLSAHPTPFAQKGAFGAAIVHITQNLSHRHEFTVKSKANEDSFKRIDRYSKLTAWLRGQYVYVCDYLATLTRSAYQIGVLISLACSNSKVPIENINAYCNYFTAMEQRAAKPHAFINEPVPVAPTITLSSTVKELVQKVGQDKQFLEAMSTFSKFQSKVQRSHAEVYTEHLEQERRAKLAADEVEKQRQLSAARKHQEQQQQQLMARQQQQQLAKQQQQQQLLLQQQQLHQSGGPR
jgi:hypothetical protein